MKNPTAWLFKVPGKKKYSVLILAALNAAFGSIGVLYALLLRTIVDSAVSKDLSEFKTSICYIILLVCVRLGLNALIRWLRELSASEIENCFKQRLIDNILRREYSVVSGTHSGEWMNRLTNDTKVVADNYVDVLPGLVGMAVKLLSALVMIIILDPWFASILLPGGFLLIILTFGFRKALKKLHKDIQEQDGRLRVFLQERIGSLIIIKSFAVEDETIREAKKYMARHKASRMKRNMFSNLCNIGFGAAMQGMYLLSAVYCAYGILQGSVTYGTMTAIMQLIGQVQAPFANISGYLPKYYSMLASAERLMEIEAGRKEIEEPVLSIREIRKSYHERIHSVVLDHISFTYDNPDKSQSKEKMPIVLNDINLNIEKGTSIALTGHSGCGKSTSLKLLLGMYRMDQGTRYIEYKDGTKEDLTARQRRLFAYVPQGNLLISGTIRDVVSLASPSKKNDDELIMKALRIACADDFVNELESGIDTQLGERGSGLSEGQMQRLAIARAIFSESPILLLDEATSALDEATEAKMLSNLQALTDRTVVIVTHRPAALNICNQIMEFTEDGVRDITPERRLPVID